MNQKVTIMIPTYNQEEFIFEAVQSALEQDYDNIEIIISDDHSSDKTAEVVKKFLKYGNVKYYRNNQNLGRVNNYKKTLYEYATGDWIVNLDGDDYFTDKKFISRAMEHIDAIQSSDSNSNIVGYLANHTNLKKINNKLIDEKIDKNTILISGRQYFLNYIKIGAFAHMACIYNREKALVLDFYNENFLAADFLSFMKLSFYGNIILSNYKIGVWRIHNNNASQRNLLEKQRENFIVIKKLADFASNFFEHNEVVNWLNHAKKNTKEMHIIDLLHNTKGINQFKILLMNFRFKRIYFVLFFKLSINNIFVSNKKY